MGLFGNYQQSRAVRELTDRVETAERQVKLLRAEWDDTYDKLRITMARIVKRAERVDTAENPKAPPPRALDSPDATGNGRLLSPTQMTHQQRIMRRRAGL